MSITAVYYIDYLYIPPWYRVRIQGRHKREWREERQVPDNFVLDRSIELKHFDSSKEVVQQHRRLVEHGIRPQYEDTEDGVTVISDESLLLLRHLDQQISDDNLPDDPSSTPAQEQVPERRPTCSRLEA